MEPVEELRYLILGAQREGARLLADLLEPAGVTAAQGEVLAVLRDAEHPLTVREIGERLVCETGSPSRLVASVVSAGLVQRGDRAGDRRAVELSLTAKGRATAALVTDVEGQLHAGLAAGLSARDIATTNRVLRTIVRDRPAGRAIARRQRATSPGG
jgi:DNA-binding MarR family transcriptional regulator